MMREAPPNFRLRRFKTRERERERQKAIIAHGPVKQPSGDGILRANFRRFLPPVKSAVGMAAWGFEVLASRKAYGFCWLIGSGWFNQARKRWNFSVLRPCDLDWWLKSKVIIHNNV